MVEKVMSDKTHFLQRAAEFSFLWKVWNEGTEEAKSVGEMLDKRRGFSSRRRCTLTLLWMQDINILIIQKSYKAWQFGRI